MVRLPHLHAGHGLLQLLQLVGGAKCLQADVSKFPLLFPELRAQGGHLLLLPLPLPVSFSEAEVQEKLPVRITGSDDDVKKILNKYVDILAFVVKINDVLNINHNAPTPNYC